jgi:hypothetical protein
MLDLIKIVIKAGHRKKRDAVARLVVGGPGVVPSWKVTSASDYSAIPFDKLAQPAGLDRRAYDLIQANFQPA